MKQIPIIRTAKDTFLAWLSLVATTVRLLCYAIRHYERGARREVLVDLAFYVGFLGVIKISATVSDYLFKLRTLETNRTVHVKMSGKFLELDAGYYENPSHNNLLQSVREKCSCLPAEFLIYSFKFAGSALVFSLAIGVFARMSPVMALVVILSLVPHRRAWPPESPRHTLTRPCHQRDRSLRRRCPCAPATVRSPFGP